MTQQIINTGTGPGAADGDSLYVAFTKVNENFGNIWAQGPVDSNISIANNSIVSTDVNGNIVLMPNGTGQVQLNASTYPGANNSYFLGDSTRRWRGLYVGTAGINTTGNLYAGNLIISGNTTYDGNITFGENVGVSGNLSVTGNTTSNYYIGNGSLLTGIVATDVGTLPSLSVTGNAVIGNISTGIIQASSAYFSSTVSSAGNASVLGILTDNYYYANGQPISFQQASGSNTQVQFNNNNNFGASSAFTFDTASNLLTVLGNVDSNYFIGNGSLLTGVVATDIGVLASLSVTGNINTGNLNGSAIVGTTISGNLEGTTASVTGNVTGGNIITDGSVVASTLQTTGNAIIGGNLAVNGNITYINIEELNVQDPIISMGRGANDTPLVLDDGKDRGEQLWYYKGSENSAFIGWQNTSNTLIAAVSASVANNIVTVNEYGSFQVGNLIAQYANVSGNSETGADAAVFGLAEHTTLANTIVQITGNSDSFTQVNFQNLNPVGSTDYVATADNGNDEQFYINMGINGSNFSDPEFEIAGPNDGYLYVTGSDATGYAGDGNLIIGSTSGNVKIFTGNTVQSSIVATFGEAYVNINGAVDISGSISGSVVTGEVVNGNTITANTVSASMLSTVGNSYARFFIGESISLTANAHIGNVWSDNYLYANGAPVDWQQPAGANTQIQFNNDSNFGASANLTFDTATNLLTVGGNVSATGNLYVIGSISSDSAIVAEGNVAGQNFYSDGELRVIGNLQTGIGAAFLGTGGYTTLANTIIQATGNIPDFAQVNFQNLNELGSTDFVATADVGNDETYFIDMGIQGSNAPYGTMQPLDGYLIMQGSDSVAVGGNLYVGAIAATGPKTRFVIGGLEEENVVAEFDSTQAHFIVPVNVDGNITVGNLSTIGNAEVSGLLTDNIYYANGTPYVFGTAAGANTQIQFNNDSNFGASANLTFDTATDLLTVTGAVSITGNVDAGNVNTGYLSVSTVAGADFSGGNIRVNKITGLGGEITAQGNISGENLNSGNLSLTGNIISEGNFSGNVTVSGNVNATDLSLIGNVYAAYANISTVAGVDIDSGNLRVNQVTGLGGHITAQGNITGANLFTGGNISATGTITGGNVSVVGDVNTLTLQTTGNAIIGGNLAVNGNITYINVEELNVQDPIITMGRGANNTPLTVDDGKDRGEQLWYYKTSEQSAFIGWQNTTGKLIAASNASVANNIVTVNSYGTFVLGDLEGTTASLSANVTGGNLLTGGLVSASGTVTGSTITGSILTGTLSTAAQPNITSVGTLTSLNSGAISSSGNVTGANLITGGTAFIQYATGSQGYVQLTDGVNSGFLIGVGSSYNTWAGGNSINLMTSTAGNIGFFPNQSEVGRFTTSGLTIVGTLSASGNITGANILTGGLISSAGNLTSGNITTAGKLTAGNIIVSGDNITDTNGRVNVNSAAENVDFAVSGTTANVFYVDAGTNTVSIGNSTQTTNVTFAINATDSMLLPVGNTFQRPGTPVVGMVRFNTTLDTFEFYSSNDGWTASGGGGSTSLTSQTFTGDSSTTVFTLSNASTTVDSMVQINGITQVPTAAYTIVGTTLTFTEAPDDGDTIEVREIVAQSTVHALTNSTGNASISVSDASNSVTLEGILLLDPTTQPASPQAGMVYFDSGTSKLRCYDGSVWHNLF